MKKKVILLVIYLVLNQLVFSQGETKVNKPLTLAGEIGFTTNGFSPIPTFSLGEPALQACVLIKKERFMYRSLSAVSYKGELWYLAPWFHYKLIDNEHFAFDSRISYSYSFKEKGIIEDNKKRDLNYSYRFLNFELSPVFSVSKNISLEIIYRIATGLDYNTSDLINWLTLNTTVNNINLGKNFRGNLYSMLYYLNMDGDDGVYFSPKFGISYKKLPFTIASQFNQPIKTSVSPNNGFVWNVSIAYSFK